MAKMLANDLWSKLLILRKTAEGEVSRQPRQFDQVLRAEKQVPPLGLTKVARSKAPLGIRSEERSVTNGQELSANG